VTLLAHRRVFLSLAAGAVVGVGSGVVASPAFAADAAKLIQDVSTEVIELIKTTTGAQREAGIRKVLETNFDLPYMGRSALATYWDQTTEEQRTRFLKAAIAAEAKAYAERFGQYGGQTLSVGKVSSRPNGVQVVDSRLNQSNGQPIKIEWEVRNDRISDVKIEGVSMVATRRSDYKSYINGHGNKVEPLIEELEQRAKGQ
jgi:phospholipid transport system substrate-binding protein